MSTLQAILVGVAFGLVITGVRVAWTFWTTRVNTLGDYLAWVLLWWHDRRDRSRI